VYRASAGLAAFAALAGLVAAGALTSLDQWAIDHAMPFAQFTGGKPSLTGALVPLWHESWHPAGRAVADVVTLPAYVAPATAVVALACLRLRGRRAATLAAAFVVGNLAEVITKATLTRPALHWHGLHLAGFDNSYPSGHTIRTVLVVAAVAWAWPRARRWAAAWAACSLAALELAGLHVPSDIAGGLLLAGALVLAAASRTSSQSTSRPAWRACRPSSRAP
jgi:membrane-associated phospholipid phosphatase